MNGYARVCFNEKPNVYEACGDTPADALQALVNILKVNKEEYIRGLNVQEIEEESWCITCYA